MIIPLGHRCSRKPTSFLFTSHRIWRAKTHLSCLGWEPENPAAWSVSHLLQNDAKTGFLLGIGCQPVGPTLPTRSSFQPHVPTPALVQAIPDNYNSLTGPNAPPGPLQFLVHAAARKDSEEAPPLHGFPISLWTELNWSPPAQVPVWCGTGLLGGLTSSHTLLPLCSIPTVLLAFLKHSSHNPAPEPLHMRFPLSLVPFSHIRTGHSGLCSDVTTSERTCPDIQYKIPLNPPPSPCFVHLQTLIMTPRLRTYVCLDFTSTR